MPSLRGERRRPFRLYLCSARLDGRGAWAAIAAAVNRRLLAPHRWRLGGGAVPKLRLVVSGPALAKEHVSC